jgi:hypothetical protein
MQMRVATMIFLIATFCAAQAHLAIAQFSSDQLERDFISPPSSAKPRVWWHWMNGNITQAGIKLDLEWMSRIGLGGVQTFDAAYNTPRIVDQRLVFMTSPWKDAFRTAATLADRLGLELAIAGSPGWSESGGPWVKPEQAMKKLVWTETRVAGGSRFMGRLPLPPANGGPFQDVPVLRGLNSLGGPGPIESVPDLYVDVAVIAYPLTPEDRTMTELHPMVTSSAGTIDARLLWDGHFSRAIHLPYGKQGGAAWIQLDFGHPQIVKSMTLGLQQLERVSLGPKYIGAELQCSTNGSTFRPVAAAYDTSEDTLQSLSPVQQTVTFAPVRARYFRLVLPTPPGLQLAPAWAALLPPESTMEHQVTEFVLSPTPRVDHVEQKAAYFLDAGLKAHPTQQVAARDVIKPSEIIDLTGQLRPHGALDWTPPIGRWAILRIGYSLLGVTNHPASPEGTGLEVDKLSRSAVMAHMNEYLGRYESMLGSHLIGSHGLRAMVNDSYEAGPQNWTDELPSEFARRRGYDLRHWLPALTGRIIGSAEVTDQFLWDFRRTLGELIAENHYGQISASLHSRGMLHYGEAHEINRAFIGDGMDAKRENDIPMAAMWVPVTGLPVSQEQGDADIRESASVAHIYGQNLVAAESMTAFGTAETAFGFAPETLKPTADRELANGLNLFVIHTSAHQPLADKSPGVTLGPFGQWFTRNETWAEEAAPWIKYLARSSYLLQQGHFVADVVYYYGQDSNITALFGNHLPPVPAGYEFDFASAHALTKLVERDGNLVTTSGMLYRILALDPRARLMSLDVLKTIAHLVYAGATIVGDKPLATPSLSDSVAEFHELTDMLWGDGTAREHRYGAGRVISGRSIAQVLQALRIEPDFQYSKPRSDTSVGFVHRQLTDGDLYFVSNRQDRSEYVEARFRVSGKAPELWHADSGVIEPVSFREDGGRTIVPLNLDPHEAVFVVFCRQTSKVEREIPESFRELLYTLKGPWAVHFQEHRGAPERAVFTELESWTVNSDVGIKYFSGTASYDNTFEVPASWLDGGQSLEIDLGDVRSLAEVIVNGMSAGIVWKRPFRTDITKLLHAGANRLTLRVTNLWPNRLIGDKQPGAPSIAVTTLNPYTADSSLLRSGLLGPVRIVRLRVEEVPSGHKPS